MLSFDLTVMPYANTIVLFDCIDITVQSLIYCLFRQTPIYFCWCLNKAYAAAAYLRTVLDNDTVEVHLIMAKTKIAPLKKYLSHV